MNKENFLCLITNAFFKNILRLSPTWLLRAWNLLVRSTKDLSAIPLKSIILMIMITITIFICIHIVTILAIITIITTFEILVDLIDPLHSEDVVAKVKALKPGANL